MPVFDLTQALSICIIRSLLIFTGNVGAYPKYPTIWVGSWPYPQMLDKPEFFAKSKDFILVRPTFSDEEKKVVKHGATTLSKMTPSITKLRKITLIMLTISITSLSIATLSVMTLSIKRLFATLIINDFQHKNTLPLCWVLLC